ncbi:MAG TPA: MotE family protein [Candidatus Wunengus sp. YC60]|uniref:MotE family protein n=1 Tax=Candidatus Wunengus sp. YC60 TaxID=3367697 RepID=UPI004027709A
MKLPINKKMMMLPGIGIVVFGVSVMGMLFMRGSKTPPVSQTTQEKSQDGEENGNTSVNQGGTATAKLAKADKEKKEKVTAKLPYVYKQNATTIFKPLSSNEVSKMLKEIEAEKHKYEKRNELLDLKEKTIESLRADMEAERKELDTLKQELNKVLDSVATQKVALKKETIQFDEAESKNIKKLASVYGGMKPEKAAMIIKEMDEETAVKLLTMMDGKSSGKILESFEPNLAVKLSEKLKLLKSDFKSVKK